MTKLTWVATKSGTWTTPGNWSPSQVPGAADDVLFDGSGADLSFVRTQTVNTLTLDDPTTLLSVSGLLTVLDDLMINAGTLSVDSGANAVLTNFSNQGTIIFASGATLTATGSYTTDSVERIGGAGGNLILGGTLDNIGNTLTLGSVVPTVDMSGTIMGGTVVGTVPLVFATFDGVTVDGAISVRGGTLIVNNGLVIRSADGSGPGTLGSQATPFTHRDRDSLRAYLELFRIIGFSVSITASNPPIRRWQACDGGAYYGARTRAGVF